MMLSNSSSFIFLWNKTKLKATDAVTALLHSLCIKIPFVSITAENAVVADELSSTVTEYSKSLPSPVETEKPSMEVSRFSLTF